MWVTRASLVRTAIIIFGIFLAFVFVIPRFRTFDDTQKIIGLLYLAILVIACITDVVLAIIAWVKHKRR